MSALMSSLMNVLLMAWIARSGCAARASSRIGRTGAMSGVTRVVVAVDPADDPDGRPVRRDEAGGRRCRERIGQLAEGRRLDAVERRARRLQLRHEVRRRSP